MNPLSLIILLPLLGFIFTGLLGKKLPEKITGWISSGSILASFVLSLNIFLGLKSGAGAFYTKWFTFLSVSDLNIDIAFQADQLTSVMMLVITGIGFLIHVYSIAYMHGDEGFYKFFAYLNLFVFNMLVLVMGANFLMLFFGWEGVGLCSYLLIGFWYSNADYGKAARKAFVMNRIGDLGLLLGLFLIVQQFKTLDYAPVMQQIRTGGVNPEMVNLICILLFVGAMGKSAQIPLYTWLPDAMAGPTPVSALIHAATMVTAGVYLVVRCNAMFSMAPAAREMILWVGLTTSIMAALIGLKQNDIKKVLAYSTVSQLGLMFVALGVGAYTAAMFHLITHAFFKALLFLGSGSVIHAMGGEQDIRKMGGLKSAMPITYWTFLIGTLAISGMPLLSGFFSKDEILASVFASQPLAWGLCVGSALLTGIYMFRLFWVTFHGGFRGTEDQKHHLHESPALITFPLIVLAVLSLLGGIINLPHFITHSGSHALENWLKPITGESQLNRAIPEHTAELILLGVAVLVFVIGFLFTRSKYLNKGNIPEDDENMAGTGRLLANKFRVDELYDSTFVSGINLSGDTMGKTEKGIFAATMSWVSVCVNFFSGLLSRLQQGKIHFYIIAMVAGLILLLVFNLYK